MGKERRGGREWGKPWQPLSLLGYFCPTFLVGVVVLTPRTGLTPLGQGRQALLRVGNAEGSPKVAILRHQGKYS